MFYGDGTDIDKPPWWVVREWIWDGDAFRSYSKRQLHNFRVAAVPFMDSKSWTHSASTGKPSPHRLVTVPLSTF